MRNSRAAQWRCAWRNQRAVFDRRYNSHSMCHSAITAVYRRRTGLFLAQRFARHASPITTTIYAHLSNEEPNDGVRDLPC